MCKNSWQRGFDWQYFKVVFKALALTTTASDMGRAAYRGMNSMQLLPHWIVKYRQCILILTGAREGEYPKSILADRGQPHHPADTPYCQQTSDSPGRKAQLTGAAARLPHTQCRFWLHLEKAIIAWVRKRTNLRNRAMRRNDTLPYHSTLNSGPTKPHARGINNMSMAAAREWMPFEGVIYKILTIWFTTIPPSYTAL